MGFAVSVRFPLSRGFALLLSCLVSFVAVECWFCGKALFLVAEQLCGRPKGGLWHEWHLVWVYAEFFDYTQFGWEVPSFGYLIILAFFAGLVIFSAGTHSCGFLMGKQPADLGDSQFDQSVDQNEFPFCRSTGPFLGRNSGQVQMPLHKGGLSYPAINYDGKIEIRVIHLLLVRKHHWFPSLWEFWNGLREIYAEMERAIFINFGIDFGLVIVAFYHVCFSCSEGSINGFYYDQNSRFVSPIKFRYLKSYNIYASNLIIPFCKSNLEADILEAIEEEPKLSLLHPSMVAYLYSKLKFFAFEMRIDGYGAESHTAAAQDIDWL
ncbi:hypothetical protein IEQ34_004645 [Dendrobium chrysotoxum]|uniref:Uncharacterized protein n=1 Tax=Dendrobium chrysotoxum TaxID=161865 RepID=A0AAV7HGI9_DENCH|nr:hypothetical protein IEQ34_004645 [Dendrobium chrysotoxum]